MTRNSPDDPYRWFAHPLVAQALGRLERELPAWCCYHCVGHTREVILEAMNFAAFDKLPLRQNEIIAIAAAYHDLGFVSSMEQRNEPIGAAMAQEAMRSVGGYSAEEVQLVAQMILDTAVVVTPQGPRITPSTTLSGFLLDADVSNFGREDFFDKCELFRRESKQKADKAYYAGVLALISGHTWYSNGAKQLRDQKKRENIAELERRVAALS